MSKSKAVIFDLDDTLYPERAFVMSGFRAVADWAEASLGRAAETTFTQLLLLWEHGNQSNTFDAWCAAARIDVTDTTIEDMVTVYRNHTPRIEVPQETRATLSQLQGGYLLGLVSDGWLAVQQKKLAALGIGDYFDAVVFSDQFGRAAWKPSTRPFEAVLEQLQTAADRSVYVGDNPSKDFLGPNRLGMISVQLKRPQGVYAAVEPSSAEHAAAHEIASLDQLAHLIERLLP